MNCDEFRTLVGAEPNSAKPEVLAHIQQCEECARYRQEMQAMDGLIYRALAVNVPAPAAAVETKQPRIWRMAASLLITASLVAAMSLWLLTPRESYAAEAIAHVRHEQGSLIRTSAAVDAASLQAVLDESQLRLKSGSTHVSYAMSCTFRGHTIPHLVVQTEQGPVTVLVLTEAPRQQREAIDEEGFQGVILPAPRGVIIVLGQDVPVDSVASTVLDALEYS
jgi:hypothetical protein